MALHSKRGPSKSPSSDHILHKSRKSFQWSWTITRHVTTHFASIGPVTFVKRVVLAVASTGTSHGLLAAKRARGRICLIGVIVRRTADCLHWHVLRRRQGGSNCPGRMSRRAIHRGEGNAVDPKKWTTGLGARHVTCSPRIGWTASCPDYFI